MEPATVIFLLLALWPHFSTPEPLCDFTERVVIRRNEEDVKGDLTTTYYCKDVLVVERLGEAR